MIITAITQQARFRSRYSIYIDGSYVFGLSADALLESKLYVGQELDASQVKDYQKLSADDRAYTLALAYALRRMRSSYELAQYCRRKEYDEALCDRIRDKLEGLGLIDDEKFAAAWVRNRRLLKPVSTRRLVQELRQKHVADDIVSRAISEDEADERTVLRELITRRRRQSKYQDDMKLMQYLARQGFSYDDIRASLSEEN